MSLYRLNEGSNPKKQSLKSIILGPTSKEEWNYAFKHNPKKKMRIVKYLIDDYLSIL